MKYIAKTLWAGMVWIWGYTLNKIPDGDVLEITHKDITVKIPKDKIKENVKKTKKMYNPITHKEDTQYGFYLKDIK